MEHRTIIRCVECKHWDALKGYFVGTCLLLPDERHVQVPIDNHVKLKLLTAEDFGCTLGVEKCHSK